MKRILFLSASLLLLLLCLVSCSNETRPPHETTAPPPEGTVAITFVVGESESVLYVPEGEIPDFSGSTIRPSSDTTTYRFLSWDKDLAPATEPTTYTALYTELPLVTYKVRWILEDGDYTTIVRENDVPIPPTGYSQVVKTQQYVRSFREWNTTLVPLTAEYAAEKQHLIITALYDDVRRPYEVTFMLDGRVYAKTETYYNETPTLPSEEPSVTGGYSGVAWLGSTKAVTEEGVVVTGVYTVSDPSLIAWSYDRPALSFSASLSDNDNRGGVGEEASALIYLLLEYRNAPSSASRDTIGDRIVTSLSYMMSKNGSTPNFDLEPYWCYSMLTGAVTLAHETPEIWSRLSPEVVEKYDFLMKCFAYTVNLGYDDSNNYRTGPGFRGNFHKSWNPNYRLALVPVMIYACRYFGSADALDEILLAFDYDATIAKFEAYGWSRALSNWTKKPPSIDGETALSQKEMTENGGATFFVETGKRKSGGSGVGVRTPFTYGGKRADDVAGVFNQLLEYNYSGGAVVSEYICTNGGTASIRAYIIDGTTTPYEGRIGMMHELGKDNRASAKYALDDFTLVVSNLAVFDELDIYELTADAGELLSGMVWVGNMDFLYKIAHGWMSYAESSGKSSSTFEQTTLGYYLWKDWWLAHYETDPNPDGTEGAPGEAPDLNVIDLDFESETVDVTDAETTIGSLKLRPGGTAKLGVSFKTMTDAAGNGYLLLSESDGAGGFDTNLMRSGGLTGIGEATTLTIKMTLSRPIDAEQSIEGVLRLRAGGSSDSFRLLQFAKNGNLTAFGTTVATLGETPQVIVMTLDLSSGDYRITVDGVEKLSLTLTLSAHHTSPAATSADSFAAWVETTAKNNYVFNWYSAAGTSGKTNALAVDDLLVCFF